MEIIIKNVSIKAHCLIKLVEHYHGPLCQIYSIIIVKLSKINIEFIFQIFFKAFNNLVGPNNLISTLLVFNTYFYIIYIDAFLPTINSQNIAIYKILKDIKRFNIFC